ncbi:MAG: 3-dehydroquinate synthase, partial [Verrucomicrobia bacterium]
MQIGGGAHRYPAMVGAGLVDRLGEYARKFLHRERCAIISDGNVAPLLAKRVIQSLASADFRTMLITIPAGEKSKTLKQAGAICDQMITNR